MTDHPSKLIESVFPPFIAKAILSVGRNETVLPISFNNFELSAILPTVFYMLRFGKRRGQGRFLKTFAGEYIDDPVKQRETASIERVADRLASSPNGNFSGFSGPIEKAILGDLLLGFCFENVKHDLGQDKPIQRVAPAHYMASWIDLPATSAHLRFVPEMIIGMLAEQDGQYIRPSNSGDTTWFPVATRFDENLILRVFGTGIDIGPATLTSEADSFDEDCNLIGIDQLLMIRIAQALKFPPDPVQTKGSDGGGQSIPNQRPIAETATRQFSEDLRRFIRAYGTVIPQNTFVDMLEGCISIGMTTIFTSVMEVLIQWSESGKIVDRKLQRPFPVFIDCSNGINDSLRRLAENSFDEVMRSAEHIPLVLTTLRLLDSIAKTNRNIKRKNIPTRPYATEWLDMLGDILFCNSTEAKLIHSQIDGYCSSLVEQLNTSDDVFGPEIEDILRDSQREPNAIRRVARALTQILRATARKEIIKTVDSILNIERSNGIALKRKTTRGNPIAGGTRRRREVRSLILPNTVLDYLVHLHILHTGSQDAVRPLPLKRFLTLVHERYGFCVDVAPSGMMISNDSLQLNRRFLEQRLRDLGLFFGVNDAEVMKQLQFRFKPNLARSRKYE